MEKTKPYETCSSEQLSYDLCLRMKIFDYHCVMEKFFFQRCQTQDHFKQVKQKDSKESLHNTVYHVERQ